MTPQEIIRLRLASQQLAASVCTKPEEVVARLGAMQAQEHGSAKWAIGARLQRAGAGATEAAIDGAVARRAIVRSWPMRGTIHYVAAADLRWMLALLTPRILAGTAERQKRLELDAAVFAQTRKRFSKWLKGGATLARTALLAALDQDGIPTAQNRGYHILWRHAQEGLICFGPHEGKEPTFALLDDWIPLSKSRALEGEAALEELAHRYFTGHGPATLDDFVWWSGLKVSDARRAIARAEKRLARIDGEQAEGRLTYWMAPEAATGKATRPPEIQFLPAFDEYLLGYRNREAQLDAAHAPKIVPGGNGIFLPMLLAQGRIVGTWKKAVKKKGVTVTALPFVPFPPAARKKAAEAVEAYGRFLGLPITLSIG